MAVKRPGSRTGGAVKLMAFPLLVGAVVAAGLVVLFLACRVCGRRSGPPVPSAASEPAVEPSNGPQAPAAPVVLPGLPNFHQVSEDLFRGAQPTAEGFRQLKTMGIKTVVNLRSFHSDRDEIGETGLAYEHIYMKAWNAEDEEVVRFLQIVTDPSRTPAFVHCRYGADRTGTMCALYRIAVEGWQKEDAIEEMAEGPFGFHSVYQNLVGYIQDLDVEMIKSRAGLGHQPAAAGPSHEESDQ